MKDNNNSHFNWFGSPGDNQKVYWFFIALLALIEIGFGISIFFR